MTLELHLDGHGIYYLRENGTNIISLHYGRDGHDPPEVEAKHLSIIIDPQRYGSKKRVTEIHQQPSGTLYIGLDDLERSAP